MLSGTALRKYRELLVNVYTDDDIARVLSDAGIKQSLVTLKGNAQAKWYDIVKVANDLNKFGNLLSVAQKDYKTKPEVVRLCHSYQQQQKLLALIKSNNIAWDELLPFCQPVLAPGTIWDSEIDEADGLIDFLFDLPLQQGKAHRPIIEFITQLASVHTDLRSALTAWQDETATLLGWTVAKMTVPAGQADVGHEAPSVVYVLIEIGCNESDRREQMYTLTIRFWVDDKPMPLLHCKHEERYTIDKIEETWEQVFRSADLRRWYPKAAKNLHLEFIVPYELLSYPFEKRKIPHHAFERYGTIYPVVVRSYDRLYHSEHFVHEWWSERTTKAKQTGCTFEDQEYTCWVCDPHTLDAEELYNAWSDSQKPVCLKLTYTPTAPEEPIRSDNINLLLDAGVPIAVWCRSPDLFNKTPADLRTQIGDLIGAATSLTQLPEQLIKIRKRAKESELGSHLVLLWDDATRCPNPNDDALIFTGP
ncbi:MAG: effector-associated domain EAD1-containing protein [Caldilineaceae bacterium]